MSPYHLEFWEGDQEKKMELKRLHIGFSDRSRLSFPYLPRVGETVLVGGKEYDVFQIHYDLEVDIIYVRVTEAKPMEVQE